MSRLESSREITFTPVTEDEFDSLFSVVKQGLHPYVDAVFGWDDDFQRERLKSDYQPDWFYWIYSGSEQVGLLCYKPYENAFHVHLLLLFPEYQGKQIGRRVMDKIKREALAKQRDTITLSSFTINRGAVRFYQQLGYQITESDKDFYSMALRLTPDE